MLAVRLHPGLVRVLQTMILEQETCVRIRGIRTMVAGSVREFHLDGGIHEIHGRRR